MARSRIHRGQLKSSERASIRGFTWIEPLREALHSLPHSKRTFAGCGVTILAIQTFAWICPTSIGMLYAPLVLGALFAGVNSLRFLTSFPKTFPFVIALVMQLWSIFVSIYANRYLGRPILFGRPETYILWAIIPGLVAYMTCSIAPNLRRLLMRMIVGIFAISAVVAWLQFGRFPPAMTLSRIYTYKSIDNWDGHPGIRAVGLSSQPNHLGFQAVMGLVLVCAAVVTKPLTRRQFALAVLFAGGAFFTQSRAAFIPLAFACIFILAYSTKYDKKIVIRSLFCLMLVGIVSLPIAAKRLQYLTMTTSGQDSSYATREAGTWAQLKPILPRLPLTGIGPSSGLLLGTGPEDKWVPVGHVVESGYLLCQAMYGIPGLAIMVVGIFGSALLAIRGIACARDPVQKELLAVGTVCGVHLAANFASFNTVDSYIHLPFAMIIAGMAAVVPGGELHLLNPIRHSTRSTNVQVV